MLHKKLYYNSIISKYLSIVYIHMLLIWVYVLQNTAFVKKKKETKNLRWLWDTAAGPDGCTVTKSETFMGADEYFRKTQRESRYTLRKEITSVFM